MAEPVYKPIRVVPSLLHFSSVKVALPLFKGFDIATWKIILEEMMQSNPPRLNGALSGNPEVNRAKGKLIQIPAHLRLGVMETIMRLNTAVELWRAEYAIFTHFRNVNDAICWRADGTIHRLNTVEQLKNVLRNEDKEKVVQVILNDDLKIDQRFYLACLYSNVPVS